LTKQALLFSKLRAKKVNYYPDPDNLTLTVMQSRHYDIYLVNE